MLCVPMWLFLHFVCSMLKCTGIQVSYSCESGFFLWTAFFLNDEFWKMKAHPGSVSIIVHVHVLFTSISLGVDGLPCYEGVKMSNMSNKLVDFTCMCIACNTMCSCKVQMYAHTHTHTHTHQTKPRKHFQVSLCLTVQIKQLWCLKHMVQVPTVIYPVSCLE